MTATENDSPYSAYGMAELAPLTKAMRFFLRFKDEWTDPIPDIDDWDG